MAVAAPAMYPDTRSLKTIEGNKNTYLLSLCRVGTDPLLPWLGNTASRRRAVRLACMIAEGPDWRRMCLCRLWNYYGHLARSPIQHPMRVLLNVCSSSNLRRGLKASWVSDLPVRKLQKICAVIAPDHVRAAAGLWEVCAQDRKVWQKLQKEWLQHWLPKSREPQPTVEYLLQRQLVLLKRKSAAEQMFLRPARDVLTEAPKQPTSAIWLLQEGDGCQLVLMLQGQDVRHAISVLVRPYDANPLGQALALLTTGAKLVSLLESFWQAECPLDRTGGGLPKGYLSGNSCPGASCRSGRAKTCTRLASYRNHDVEASEVVRQSVASPRSLYAGSHADKVSP